MPLRIHVALDRWRAAERVLADTPEGSPGRHEAEEAVALAREEYLAVVRVVAEDVGSQAMPDLTESQLYRLEHPTDPDRS